MRSTQCNAGLLLSGNHLSKTRSSLEARGLRLLSTVRPGSKEPPPTPIFFLMRRLEDLPTVEEKSFPGCLSSRRLPPPPQSPTISQERDSESRFQDIGFPIHVPGKMPWPHPTHRPRGRPDPTPLGVFINIVHKCRCACRRRGCRFFLF